LEWEKPVLRDLGSALTETQGHCNGGSAFFPDGGIKTECSHGTFSDRPPTSWNLRKYQPLGQSSWRDHLRLCRSGSGPV